LERDIHIFEDEVLIGQFNFNYIVRKFSSLIRSLSYLCKLLECEYLEGSLERGHFEGYIDDAKKR